MFFNKNRQKSQTALASITASLPEIIGNQTQVDSNESFINENTNSAFYILSDILNCIVFHQAQGTNPSIS